MQKVLVAVALAGLSLVSNTSAEEKAAVVQHEQPGWAKDWPQIAEVLSTELATADLGHDELVKARENTRTAKWILNRDSGYYESKGISAQLDKHGRLNVRYPFKFESREMALTYILQGSGKDYEVVERKISLVKE